MQKNIKEIREIKGFNELTQQQRHRYIEYIHDILADTSLGKINLMNVSQRNDDLIIKLNYYPPIGEMEELIYINGILN